jgi:hypothetical protein
MSGMKMKCAVPNCKGLAEIPCREKPDIRFHWICRNHAKTLIGSFMTNRISFELDGRLGYELVG